MKRNAEPGRLRRSLASPEPGSRLARYTEYMREGSGFDEDQFDRAPAIMRVITTNSELSRARTVADLPRAIVREVFVVNPSIELGMPDEPWAPGVLALIEAATDAFIREHGAELCVEPGAKAWTPAREARNQAKFIVECVFFELWAKAGKSTSMNAIYTAVASHLGGITDDHVRRCMMPTLYRVCTMSPEVRAAYLDTCIAVEELLREHDEAVRSADRVLPFQRTPSAESISRQTGDINEPTI